MVVYDLITKQRFPFSADELIYRLGYGYVDIIEDLVYAVTNDEPTEAFENALCIRIEN